MKYYYFINSFNNRKGPFRIDELHNYNILRTTLVWCEGMPNWQPAGQVPELAFLFQSQNYGQGYSQSYTQTPQPLSNKPDSYLVWSILNLIFCNLFVGIAALVFRNTIGTVRNMTRLHRHPKMPVSLILSVWYWVFLVWWHGL
jgi:hypothetical protein